MTRVQFVNMFYSSFSRISPQFILHCQSLFLFCFNCWIKVNPNYYYFCVNRWCISKFRKDWMSRMRRVVNLFFLHSNCFVPFIFPQFFQSLFLFCLISELNVIQKLMCKWVMNLKMGEEYWMSPMGRVFHLFSPQLAI